MILTTCAACAAPLAHTAPRCIRCHTRYCDSTCQHDHWRRGHKQMCKKIHRGGNAEQYNADKKYKEAVAAAVEKCADDTKGQTCYICTQALHWKTKEGLVRGCACRGTAGLAHVSCLAEQAKILFAEAEENNLGHKALNERSARWHTCSLCEQKYHGVVCHALGWACWKTYLGRPETDRARFNAMNNLAAGLREVLLREEALIIYQSFENLKERFVVDERFSLCTQTNIAACLDELGRKEEALVLKRRIYTKTRDVMRSPESVVNVFVSANNLAVSLRDNKLYAEANLFMRERLPEAREALGRDHSMVLHLYLTHARTLSRNPDASREDLIEAVVTLENDTYKRSRQVLGEYHPITLDIAEQLEHTRARLAHEFPGPSPLRDELDDVEDA